MHEYVVILDVSARRFYEEFATRAERRRLEQIINDIAVEPYVDFEKKFPFVFPPVNGVLFADGEFWVLYEISESNEIEILNIGLEEEPPKPVREM